MVCLWKWALFSVFIACIHGATVDEYEALLLQPIGIDFGPEVITVAYAHSSDNVSILAMIKPSKGDPYYRHLFRLRRESLDGKKSRSLYGRHPPRADGITDALRRRVSGLLSKVKPLEGDVDVSWSWDCVRSIGTQSRIYLSAYRHIYPSRLKDEVQKDHNIDIQSCILAVPEFFNLTLAELVIDASREAGVTPLHGAMKRTVMSVYSRGDGAKRDSDNTYLIMDLGEFYLDLRTVHSSTEKATHDVYLPMGPWSSTAINQELTERVIRGSEVLPDWLSSGGNKILLQYAVRKARFLIRNDLDAEIMEKGENEDHHHDEYPLDLTWPGGDDQESVGAVLSWADVHAEEMRYVDSLARNIRNYLIVAKGIEDGSGPDNTILHKIDKAFILTAGFDGQLIKRAIKQAIGHHIEIIGGIMREFHLAAEGAAQGALLWRQVQEKKQRLNRQ